MKRRVMGTLGVLALVGGGGMLAVPAATAAPISSAKLAAPEAACVPVTPLETGTPLAVTESGDGAEPGTLRWAVAEANATPGTDEILIAAGLTVQSTGNIEITDGLRLAGAGAISHTGDGPLMYTAGTGASFPVQLDGLSLSGAGPRAFGLLIGAPTTTLELTGVTLSGFSGHGVLVTEDAAPRSITLSCTRFTGLSGGPTGTGAFAVVNPGGAVDTSITVAGSTFTDNRLPAILIDGTLQDGGTGGGLTVVDTQITGTEVANAAAPVTVRGVEVGASGATPLITIERSALTNNVGTDGGALFLEGGRFRGDAPADTQVVRIADSSFVDNNRGLADDHPGSWRATDIELGWLRTELPADVVPTLVHVENSTFRGAVPEETAEGEWGPSYAPTINTSDSHSALSLNHVTMVGGGLQQSNGGGATRPLHLRNSLLSAGTQEPIRVLLPARMAPAAEGASATADEPSWECGPSDVSVVEERMAYTTDRGQLACVTAPDRVVAPLDEYALEELALAGGPTPVMVPGAESKLIDAAGPGGPAIDQRGVARPQGPAADIGAVERREDPPVVDPVAGLVRLGADEVAAEGAPLTFTVTREAIDGRAEGAASVRVSTTDGTATAGADYTAVSLVVEWADGETGARSVTVPTLTDAVVEPDETLTLALSEPSAGLVVGSPAAVQGTITDVPGPEKPGPENPGPEKPGTEKPGPGVTPPAVSQGSGDAADLAHTGAVEATLWAALAAVGVLAGLVTLALARRGRTG